MNSVIKPPGPRILILLVHTWCATVCLECSVPGIVCKALIRGETQAAYRLAPQGSREWVKHALFCERSCSPPSSSLTLRDFNGSPRSKSSHFCCPTPSSHTSGHCPLVFTFVWHFQRNEVKAETSHRSRRLKKWRCEESDSASWRKLGWRAWLCLRSGFELSWCNCSLHLWLFSSSLVLNKNRCLNRVVIPAQISHVTQSRCLSPGMRVRSDRTWLGGEP